MLDRQGAGDGGGGRGDHEDCSVLNGMDRIRTSVMQILKPCIIKGCYIFNL